jgi:hypothetical protein
VNRLRGFAALLLLSRGLFAQVPSVPYAQFFGPDFDNVHVDHGYPNTAQSIQKVDFRNMRLIVFDQSGKTDTVMQFKNGGRKWKEKGGEVDEARIEEVDYLAAPGASGAEYALVVLHWLSIAEASNADGYAQVFRMANHELRVIQQIRWNEQFETKEKYTFDAATKTLTVRSAHYLTGDAHCCISAMDVFTLQWKDGAFVQTAVKTELSDYGKKEGKTLPK